MATVVPKVGQEKEAAQLLLFLADDPRDVRTNTDNGFVFLVPDELEKKYVAALKQGKEEPIPDQSKRRPGRPRKVSTVDSEDEGGE